MVIKEYGVENQATIILLHGGGLSWWNYKEEAILLRKKYHVIIPILDGHADSDQPFISIEKNAEELIQYIDEQYQGSVYLIGGLSLGAQVLVEMLSQRKNICQYAIIESALIVPMHFIYRTIGPMIGMSYGLIKQNWFSKLQFQTLKIRESLYDEYYRDTCKITKKNMIAFLKANASYGVKETLHNTEAKVKILVGGNEQKAMITSARMLHERIPNSALTILNGYEHGQLSINYPEEYVGVIKQLVK